MKYRINAEKGIIEFDNGTSVPLDEEQKQNLTQSPATRELSEKYRKKKLEDYEIAPAFTLATSKINPLAKQFESTSDYLNTALESVKPRKGQEKKSYIDRLSENYSAIRKGRQKGQAQVEKAHPTANTLSSILGLPGDLAALPSGVPGVVAAPVLGFLNSDKSLVEEPLSIGKDVVKDAALGLVLDTVVHGLSRFSSIRKNRQLLQEFADREPARVAQGERNRQTAFAKGQETVSRNAETLSGKLGKNSIPINALAIKDFIVKHIHTSRYAGSKEAKEAESFVQSLFSQGGKKELNASALEDVFNAIEGKIASGDTAEEVRLILKNLKGHLEEVLPKTFGHVVSHGKHSPKIFRQVASAVDSALTDTLTDHLLRSHLPKDTLSVAKESMRERIGQILSDSKGAFATKAANGELAEEIVQAVKDDPVIANIVYSLEKETASVAGKKGAPAFSQSKKLAFQRVQRELEGLSEKVRPAIESSLQRISPNIGVDSAIASGESGISLGKMQRFPEPTMPPLMREAPPPQGALETLADSLNKLSLGNVFKGFKRSFEASAGKAIAGAAGLGALSLTGHSLGIPLGKVAGYTALGVGGAKAITSPALFRTIQQSGSGIGFIERSARQIESAVDQIASRLPSYQNGVLTNPVERQFLSHQLETMQIPLEDRAVLQMRINRGLPLTQ